MCREPLHQLMLGHSHLTQSLFSNQVRTILCTHRDGCFKEMVNGKTQSTNMQSKQTKPNNIDHICGQGWDVPTTTMVCAWSSRSWLLLSSPRQVWPYSSGKEQNSSLVEWFLWMVCHLYTIRKPVSWLSPTIHIYLKGCRLSVVGPHGLPPSPIAAYCPACALSFCSIGLLMQLLACLCMHPLLLSQSAILRRPSVKSTSSSMAFSFYDHYACPWGLEQVSFTCFYAQYKARQIIWHRVTIHYFSYFWTQLLGEKFQLDIWETNCLVSFT